MWTTASAWILARRAEIAGASGQCLRRRANPLAEPRFQCAPVDLPRTSEGEGVDEVQFAWGGGGVEREFDEGTEFGECRFGAGLGDDDGGDAAPQSLVGEADHRAFPDGGVRDESRLDHLRDDGETAGGDGFVESAGNAEDAVGDGAGVVGAEPAGFGERRMVGSPR